MSQRPTLPAHLDITSPRAYTDPPKLMEAYQWLRDEQPISWVDREPYRPFWAITRHADILEIEKLNELFINGPRLNLLPQEVEQSTQSLQPTPLESLKMLFALLRNSNQRWADFKSLSRTRAKAGSSQSAQVRTVIQMDEPDHHKYRMLTHQWFMGKRVKQLRPTVESIANRHIDKMLNHGGACEFAGGVANWYPLEVIMLILGLPLEDAPKLLVWTQQLLNASDPELQKSAAYGTDVMLEMYEYFSALVAARRTTPSDDLASVIVHSQIDNEPLELVEMLSYFLIVATAGHETTSSAIAGGVHAFCQNPDQYAKLRQAPDLARQAAEEAVRWATPVKHFTRTATADYQLHGQLIKKDESVAMFYLSANRDERVFSAPNEFRIDRHPNKHLGFGHGAHLCLGKNLASMEIEIFFQLLAKRVTSLQLAGQIDWIESNFTNGIKRLPIKFVAASTINANQQV